MFIESFFQEFPQNNKNYQLTWLGTVKKSKHIENSYIISAYFREILNQENKKQFHNQSWTEKESAIEKFSLDLPMGAIPILQLGSIWRNGKIIGLTNSEKLIIKGVKFDKENCLLIKATESYSNGKYYIPRYLYPLSNNAWKTNILVFPNKNFTDSTTTHFVLPSTEVFRSEYTNSSNLTELLMYGDWVDKDNGIYNPYKSWFDQKTNIHYIQLRQKVLNIDVPLVARFFFSSYAQKCLNHFHNELKKSLIKFKEAGITCYPPFIEEVDLVVYGETLKTDDREFFLIYRIESSTSPFPFSNLVRGRDNDSEKIKGADISSLKPYGRAPKRKGKEKEEEEKEPKSISTTQEKSKMTSTIWENYTSNRFLSLEGINISKREKEEQTHYGLPQSEIDSPFIYSLEGGGYGADCLTPLGIAEILKMLDPNLITRKRKEAMPAKLEKTKDGLEILNQRNDISLNFIQIYPHLSYRLEYTSFISGRKAWCFIDGRAKTQRRQILVAEIKTDAKTLYLLELERRESQNGKNNEKFSTLLLATIDFKAIEIQELSEFVDSCVIKEGWINENEMIHLRRTRLHHTSSTLEEFADKIYDDICNFTITVNSESPLTEIPNHKTHSIIEEKSQSEIIPFPKAA